MSPTDSLFAHWYFHVPNLILAALMYTLIGRYVLDLAFEALGGRKDAVVLTVFRRVTDPVLRVVRFITPEVVPNGLVLIFAVVWLLALRMFWYLTVVAAGARPKLGI